MFNWYSYDLLVMTSELEKLQFILINLSLTTFYFSFFPHFIIFLNKNVKIWFNFLWNPFMLFCRIFPLTSVCLSDLSLRHLVLFPSSLLACLCLAIQMRSSPSQHWLVISDVSYIPFYTSHLGERSSPSHALFPDSLWDDLLECQRELIVAHPRLSLLHETINYFKIFFSLTVSFYKS